MLLAEGIQYIQGEIFGFKGSNSMHVILDHIHFCAYNEQTTKFLLLLYI